MINRNSQNPLYLQLYDYFKTAILNNTLKAYTKLPSIRELQQKQKLSKTTIEKAYNQLQIEGFIQSQPKSGHYVLPIKNKPNRKTDIEDLSVQEPSYLNIAQPVTTFNLEELKKALQHVIHYQGERLYHPPKPSGENTLKEAIIKHLRNERGVKGSSHQIIIDSGIQNHLKTIGNILEKRRVGYLIPLFHHAKRIFNLLNFTLIPFETLDEMVKDDLDFIYISPSNLYPSGNVVPFNERLRLIDYAKKHNAYIIEDDYNYIYRHNAYQIPSIQSLSNGFHVIYIGSFTRQILPSLRLSYMVLPPTLLKAYHALEPLTQNVSVLDQLTIAQFIHSGSYQKHLRKLSSFSKKQNEMMRKILSLHTNQAITYSGLDSNLHVLFSAQNITILKLLCTLFTKQGWSYRRLDELPNTVLLPYHGFLENDFNILNDILKKIASYSHE